jgi:hypothetical protein
MARQETKREAQGLAIDPAQKNANSLPPIPQNSKKQVLGLRYASLRRMGHSVSKLLGRINKVQFGVAVPLCDDCGNASGSWRPHPGHKQITVKR